MSTKINISIPMNNTLTVDERPICDAVVTIVTCRNSLKITNVKIGRFVDHLPS